MCNLAGADGVGIAAVQLARRTGAKVIAVANGEDRARRLLELGASTVIDRHVDNVAEAVCGVTDGTGVDLVIDPVGATLSLSLATFRDEGTLVSVGNAGGATLSADLWPAVQHNLSIFGVFMATLLSRPAVRATIATMLNDLSNGRLIVTIDSRFSLAEAAAAHRHAEDSTVLGRVVLIP